MGCARVIAGIGLGWAALLAASAEPKQERIVVDRAELPVLVEPRHGTEPEACLDLDPGAIDLRVGGRPARVHALGERPAKRLHAIVIDTSESMTGRLETAREIALSYARSVPSDEPVLVASFDEGVLLAEAPTLDHDRVGETIAGLTIGRRTALWESLRDLLRYLVELPGEKVMLALTDGSDSVGRGSEALRRVQRLAGAAPDVVLFVVGIDMPWTDRAERARLHRIARSTGGDVIRVGPDGRAAIDAAIRGRLAERRYVSYEPPTDAVPGSPIRIRERDGAPCRVRAIGDPELLSAAAADPEIERVPVPANLVPPACGIGRVGGVTTAIGARGDGEPVFVRLADPSTALLDLDDIVIEPGPRYRERALKDPTRLVPATAARAREEHRTVVVDLLPRERIVATRRDAVDVLRDVLLDDRFCLDGQDADGAPVRPAFVVHGQTFLAIRELLGRGMFDARSDYRAWSSEHAARRAEEHVRPLLAAASPLTLDAAVRAAREAALDPAVGRPQAWLATWLGDVAAVDAARELERRIANGLLDEDVPTARRAVVGWSRMTRLLPPAVHGRTIVPLLPAYDPARDAIGFYRFLLPAPHPDGTPSPTVPPRALALELLLWLEARGMLGGIAPPGSEVTEIVHGAGEECPAAPDELDGIVVRLERSGADGGSVSLFASFGDSSEPACFAVGPGAEPSSIAPSRRSASS